MELKTWRVCCEFCTFLLLSDFSSGAVLRTYVLKKLTIGSALDVSGS